jgi:AraC-like DNA-binding protein
MSLLYLGIGRSVFVAPHVASEMHQHRTFEITLALEKPFAIRVKGGIWRETNAVAIRPNVQHQMKSPHGMRASIHLVPEPRWSEHLNRVGTSEQQLQFLDGRAVAPFVKFFRALLHREHGCSPVFRIVEELLQRLTGMQGYKGRVDDRLLAVLDYIQANLARPISSRTLSTVACLSEDRFLHLFKEQLGLPLRPYILNQRMMCALQGILWGKTITQAAIDAGFSDSAHLTRRFIQATGLRPSRLKHLRGRVKIYTCSSSRCVRPTLDDPEGNWCLNCGLFSQERSH